MPVTLTIQSRRGHEEGQVSQRVFNQPVITIGRSATVDVVLEDSQRMVSSRHGEIRKQGNSWVLVDLGSTNGTELNQVRLIARNEYGLKDGDQIKLGDFLLIFKAPHDRPEASQANAAIHSQHVRSPAGDADETLLYLLRRASADADCVSPERRQEHVQQLLRQTVGHLDRQSAKVRLESLKKRLSEGPPAPATPAPRLQKARFSVSDLPELAHVLFKDTEQPLSPEESAQVAHRIEQVLRVVFAGVAAAIKGRREFQREFEVEATRILDWAPNPIKHAETAEEIASLLLDPRAQGLSEEQVTAHLQDVFQDLTLHQLGLMAGFRECVRGLLKEFDPVSLTKGEKGRSTGKGLGLLSGKGARADAAAWQRFLEKYRQLTEEEVKVFERILAPHFTTGYLSVHKTRKRT
jgi:type VI secretion system FHA domain protein